MQSDAVPMEVIVGVPGEDYGARVTMRLPSAAPRWVGLRTRPSDPVRRKYYHPIDGTDHVGLPPGLPGPLHPIMRSDDGEATEIYVRHGGRCGWHDFVARCTAPLGAAPPAAFHPEPLPALGGFGASFRWHGGRLAGVSVFACRPSLPEDAALQTAWVEGMTDPDRQRYECALAGVRSLGPKRADLRWNAILAWSFEPARGWHRAVSLRVPATLEIS